jgi:hypothetical protein
MTRLLDKPGNQMVITNFMITYFYCSERASMFQWMGPKRYTPPACTIDQLPGYILFQQIQ